MVWSRFLAVACVAGGAVAHAQSPASSTPVAVSKAYTSAFIDYRPYADIEIGSWKRANDDVAMVGGPMGQMRPGAMPAAPAAAAPTKSASPAAPKSVPTPDAGRPR